MIELINDKINKLEIDYSIYLDFMENATTDVGAKYYDNLLNETKAKINVLKELLEEWEDMKNV